MVRFFFITKMFFFICIILVNKKENALNTENIEGPCRYERMNNVKLEIEN